MSEEELRIQDAIGSRNEHDRVVTNWIEHKFPWNKLHNKRELILGPNESRLEVYDNLWGICVEIFMEHLMK